MFNQKKISKTDKALCRLITPEFRVSYPNVFKPQAPNPDDKLKYSITMLFPKDSDLMGSALTGEARSLKQVIRNAKKAYFGPNKEDWPKDLLSPIVDGDLPKFADKSGYKGHWAIKATTSEEYKPRVVDHEMNPIVDPNVLYPGCYARAFVYTWVWTFMGKQGVGFILNHVQKLRDGKSFGGKKPVEEVFQPVRQVNEDEDDSDEGFI